MRPLALHLLRRVALYALALAFLLVAVPWVLTEVGLMGPTPAQHVEAAARVLEVARAYGATEGDPSFRQGLADLARARQLAAADHGRDARRAAAEARARGIEAQRVALAAHEELRRRAKVIVNGTDDLLDELEDLYAEAGVGRGKHEMAPLLSLMKEARQAGGGVVLAFEQGDYARVIAGEKTATETLVRTRAALKGARKKP